MYVLESRVALITGAGSGMGRACALAYTRAGAKVVLVGRRQDPLEKVKEQITNEGGEALVAVADVSDELAVRDTVRKAQMRFGSIEILVNNAGDQGPGAPVWEVDPARWRHTLDVNLWGPFLLCRAVLPEMVTRRYGKIINVASGAGNHPMPFFSGYSASKAALIHFTRTIAEELKPYGITANAMGVRGITPMWKDVLEAGPGGGATTESIRAQVADGMRPKVEENLPVFLFLAAAASDHVTGQYIEANSLPSYLIGE